MEREDDVGTTDLGTEPLLVDESRLIIQEPDGPRAFAIGPEPFLLGRNRHCTAAVRDSRVSAVHCELHATPQGVHVRDRSRNGTYLGKNQIIEANIREVTWLRIGDTKVRVEPVPIEPARLSEADRFGALIGATPVMRALFRRLQRLAVTDLSVLIGGETGTGKEVTARGLHDASPRAKRPFVVIDCGAIPTGLAEGLLFGYEVGAFTGATRRHVSPFVEANGGTVFLDEIGDLPLELQPRLLRVLAERQVRPLGARGPIDVDVRVIAATRRDLVDAINERQFRSDLYFRFAEEQVNLPLLRERRADIPVLIRHMFAAAKREEAFERILPAAMARLVAHDWPGNVRQLESVVERMLSFDDGGGIDITVSSDPSPSSDGERTTMTYEEYERAMSRAYFADLVAATGENVSEVARRSNLDRRVVRRQLLRLGIRVRGDDEETRE